MHKNGNVKIKYWASLIAPFPDHCLLVPFYRGKKEKVSNDQEIVQPT